MTAEIVISCDTISRLCTIHNHFPDSADEWTPTLRIENDLIMATNRCFIVVEKISASVSTPFHIKADANLIEVCRKEAQYNSSLHIVYNEMLGFVSGRTTFGYQHSDNLLMKSTAPNPSDRWRNIVPRQPSDDSGSLMLDLTYFQMLIEASPSKMIVFEKNFSMLQPSIIRDLINQDWFAVFHPKDAQTPHEPAKLPGWFK